MICIWSQVYMCRLAKRTSFEMGENDAPQFHWPTKKKRQKKNLIYFSWLETVLFDRHWSILSIVLLGKTLCYYSNIKTNIIARILHFWCAFYAKGGRANRKSSIIFKRLKEVASGHPPLYWFFPVRIITCVEFVVAVFRWRKGTGVFKWVCSGIGKR